MIKPLTVIVSGIYLGAALSAFASEDLSPAMKRFRAEYPAAAKRLQQSYTNLRLSARRDGPGHGSEWTYAAHEGDLRWVDNDETGALAIVTKSDLSFTLLKKPGDTQYNVLQLVHPDPTHLKKQMASIRIRATAAFAPYCVLERTVQEFISDKSFVVKSAVETEEMGEKTVEIAWENSPTPDLKRYGTFRFDPDHCWALRGYQFRFANHPTGTAGSFIDSGSHVEVEYAGERDGIPLVKRVRSWTSTPLGQSAVTTTDVKDLTVGPVAESEFTLDAFSIQTDPSPLRSPVVPYMLTLSALCAAVAAVIRFLNGRTSTTVAGSTKGGV